MSPGQTVPLSQVAEETGIPLHVLRYGAAQGKFPAVQAEANKRWYVKKSDIERIRKAYGAPSTDL